MSGWYGVLVLSSTTISIIVARTVVLFGIWCRYHVWSMKRNGKWCICLFSFSFISLVFVEIGISEPDGWNERTWAWVVVGSRRDGFPFYTITYRYLWLFSLTCTVDGMCMTRGMGGGDIEGGAGAGASMERIDRIRDEKCDYFHGKFLAT